MNIFIWKTGYDTRFNCIYLTLCIGYKFIIKEVIHTADDNCVSDAISASFTTYQRVHTLAWNIPVAGQNVCSYSRYSLIFAVV